MRRKIIYITTWLLIVIFPVSIIGININHHICAKTHKHFVGILDDASCKNMLNNIENHLKKTDSNSNESTENSQDLSNGLCNHSDIKINKESEENHDCCSSHKKSESNSNNNSKNKLENKDESKCCSNLIKNLDESENNDLVLKKIQKSCCQSYSTYEAVTANFIPENQNISNLEIKVIIDNISYNLLINNSSKKISDISYTDTSPPQIYIINYIHKTSLSQSNDPDSISDGLYI